MSKIATASRLQPRGAYTPWNGLGPFPGWPRRDPRTVREDELFFVNAEFPEFYHLDDVLPDSPLKRAYERQGDSVFSSRYIALLDRCVAAGRRQTNARTGAGIRTLLHEELQHECLFGIPLPGARKVHPHIAAAELAWTLMGTEDVAFMSRHAKIWDKFAVDGKVAGAYGFRWRKAFNRDQLALAVDTLRRDPSSRQVYVATWDPRVDGLDAGSKALAPCPVGFSLQVLDDRLNCAVTLRSSDLAVGLPYDTMVYALLIDAVAQELGLIRGLLTMKLDHAHVYETHVAVLRPRLRQPRIAGCAPAPRWALSRIETDPDGYVAETRRLAGTTPQPKALPLEAVGGAAGEER